MLPKVFDLFTQVDQSLEKTHDGLGIGLSLAKAIVELHDGGVEANSAGLGKGSEFVIRLPAVRTESEHQFKVVQSEHHSSKSCRILVADDNRDSALSLALMLKILGNDTQTAHDGLEALRVAEIFRPDVVFLDIGMPKLNGYETARKLRALPWGNEVKLVALTGWGQDSDRIRSQEAGFDWHLVKPVDPVALEQLLSAL
jgi:CheY-like chemotaxis protein